MRAPNGSALFCGELEHALRLTALDYHERWRERIGNAGAVELESVAEFIGIRIPADLGAISERIGALLPDLLRAPRLTKVGPCSHSLKRRKVRSTESCPRRQASVACYERTTTAVGNSCSANSMILPAFAGAVVIESGAINVSNMPLSRQSRGGSLSLHPAINLSPLAAALRWRPDTQEIFEPSTVREIATAGKLARFNPTIADSLPCVLFSSLP